MKDSGKSSGIPGGTPLVSVVLPVHNEANNVGPLVDSLRVVLRPTDEIIVVDDGSTDGGTDTLDGSLCRVIRHTTSRGKGAAMLTGLASVRGKVIVFMDGDGQDEPFDLPLLVEVVMAGADLAIGSRFLERESTIGGQGISPGAITKINEFGNRMLTRLINSVLGVRLTDTQSGYKCMRVERLLALRLSADRYEIETEILVRAIRSGMTVREVPVRRHPRQHGESKLYGPRFGRIVFGLRVLRVLEREVWGDRSL